MIASIRKQTIVIFFLPFFISNYQITIIHDLALCLISLMIDPYRPLDFNKRSIYDFFCVWEGGVLYEFLLAKKDVLPIMI